MNIAVFGARGKVGSRVIAVAESRRHSVWQIDKDVSENKLDKVDVVINFATAEGIDDVCEFCRARRCALVSGTTGLTEAQVRKIEDLSRMVEVVSKPNFAEGINMLYKLCDVTSSNLRGWDCAIVETHRKGKKDAPSGTAKGLASVITQNMGSFSSVDVHALRLGADVGRHEVTFENGYESLTIVHQAYSPDVFALGAVIAAEHIVNDKTAL